MARNEEKQLARLNRYYLQQQKDEELKKRPPRPKLDTINTPREIRKWLPTITRDIDFYVKQMEVACYPQSKIEEFSERIRRLKGEYRAYMQKLRALEPDLDGTPWTNRPYSSRKRHADDVLEKSGVDIERDQPEQKVALQPAAAETFVPLSTPVLQQLAGSLPTQYGFEQRVPVIWNANPDTEDQPLDFRCSTMQAITNSSQVASCQHSSLAAAGKSVAEHEGGVSNQTGLLERTKGASAVSNLSGESIVSVTVASENRPCGRQDTDHGVQGDIRQPSASECTGFCECSEGKAQTSADSSSDNRMCTRRCSCDASESGDCFACHRLQTCNLHLSPPSDGLTNGISQHQSADSEISVSSTVTETENGNLSSTHCHVVTPVHNSSHVTAMNQPVNLQIDSVEEKLSGDSKLTSRTNPLHLTYSDSSESDIDLENMHT